ncbi:hypothetical protein CISG_08383 [Coccidioides immitis RMSCC 3703]|uniref:Uncharacterized protein n=1 Tax=Coccidioides immitis RMSCC 3703 TaxID=454286 RepID=A0A0J8R926_COCIT|nr:hypothetical protein CISG_08383 [Coccidioides immitis RMSCC 3703]
MTVNSTSTKQPSILSTILLRLQAMLAAITSTLISLLDQIIPPCRREDITSRAYAFSRSRPLLASFLASQLVFCGVPLSLLFLHVASVLFFLLRDRHCHWVNMCTFVYCRVCRTGIACADTYIDGHLIRGAYGVVLGIVGMVYSRLDRVARTTAYIKDGVEKREKSDGEIGAVKEITRKMD